MNRDILISQILNNPPYQLPPVVHGNGVYSLDIQYMGERFCKIGMGLEEVLQGYFHFVTRTNHLKVNGKESITVLPVRPGSRMQSNRKEYSEKL